MEKHAFGAILKIMWKELKNKRYGQPYICITYKDGNGKV